MVAYSRCPYLASFGIKEIHHVMTDLPGRFELGAILYITPVLGLGKIQHVASCLSGPIKSVLESFVRMATRSDQEMISCVTAGMPEQATSSQHTIASFV